MLTRTHTILLLKIETQKYRIFFPTQWNQPFLCEKNENERRNQICLFETKIHKPLRFWQWFLSLRNQCVFDRVVTLLIHERSHSYL